MKTIPASKIDRFDGYPYSKGLNLVREHEAGRKISPREAIIAMCCQCMAYYVDGRHDCEMQSCPGYRWMPYKKVPKTS